jgi:hypothetical protein
VGEFIVACYFRNGEDQFTWAFAGIYGPNFDSDRRFLWDEFAGLLIWWNLAWCIGETSTSLIFLVRDPMKSVMDISFIGGTFTWSNN